LGGITDDLLSGIRTTIGPDPGIRIPRAQVIEQVAEKLTKFNAAVLLGESGSGKSAIAKQLARSVSFGRVIWLDQEFFEGSGLNAIAKSHGLVHPLPRLFKSSGKGKNLLVLDAEEKFSPRSRGNACELIKSLELQSADSRWKLILTCQPVSWEGVQQILNVSALGRPQEIIHPISPPEITELSVAMGALTRLQPLSWRPDLLEILRNLKISSKYCESPDRVRAGSVNPA